MKFAEITALVPFSTATTVIGKHQQLTSKACGKTGNRDPIAQRRSALPRRKSLATHLASPRIFYRSPAFERGRRNQNLPHAAAYLRLSWSQRRLKPESRFLRTCVNHHSGPRNTSPLRWHENRHRILGQRTCLVLTRSRSAGGIPVSALRAWRCQQRIHFSQIDLFPRGHFGILQPSAIALARATESL